MSPQLHDIAILVVSLVVIDGLRRRIGPRRSRDGPSLAAEAAGMFSMAELLRTLLISCFFVQTSCKSCERQRGVASYQRAKQDCRGAPSLPGRRSWVVARRCLAALRRELSAIDNCRRDSTPIGRRAGKTARIDLVVGATSSVLECCPYSLAGPSTGRTCGHFLSLSMLWDMFSCRCAPSLPPPRRSPHERGRRLATWRHPR